MMTSFKPPASLSPNIKTLLLRRPAKCGCGAELEVGDPAGWDRSTFVIRCLRCVGNATESAREVMFGTASTQPASQGGHAVRARSRKRFESQLSRAHNRLEVLTDREILRDRALVDYLIVGPSGVFVVELTSWPHERISVEQTGGWFGPPRSRLVVGSTDHTSEIHALNDRADAIRCTLEQDERYADVAVTPLICAIDAHFPWMGTIDIDGVSVRGLHTTVRTLVGGGPLDAPLRSQLVGHLARHLPPAARKAG